MKSRSLAPSPERIKELVCEAYHVKGVDLSPAKEGVDNEPHKGDIYLTRCLKGETLESIGLAFNRGRYTWASRFI